VAHSGLRLERIPGKNSKWGAFSGSQTGFVFIPQQELKPLPPDTISGFKMYPKCFSGRAHSATPDPLAGFMRPLCGKEGREWNGKRGEWEGGEDSEGKKKYRDGVKGRRWGKGKGEVREGAGVVVLGGTDAPGFRNVLGCSS